MILNVLGGTSRRDQPWDARYASPVITVLGGTNLDFRQAELDQGETEVVILALLGGVEVVVPDDLPVIVTGLSVLGGRNVLGGKDDGLAHGTDRATPDFHGSTGRRLRLSIFTMLGGVEVRRVPVMAGMTV